MTKPTKKPPKRPAEAPIATEPAEADLDQTIDVAIDAISEGLTAIRRRIRQLAAEGDLDRETSSHLAWLTKQASLIMGDVRKRQEQEQRRYLKLTPGQVLLYLRNADPETRATLVREASRIDEEGSVLG